MKIRSINIWFGRVPLFRTRVYPKFSSFDGGSYWKFSISWFKYLLEFSGLKHDNTIYKRTTSEELDKILKDLK